MVVFRLSCFKANGRQSKAVKNNIKYCFIVAEESSSLEENSLRVVALAEEKLIFTHVIKYL